MTTQEFIEELKVNNMMSEDFEKKLELFRHYQKLAIDTLVLFSKICDTNNIEYQLFYGSLLGAIRDNGQIPWDYDIDVLVPYSQRNKLINTLNKELSDGYYFVCSENKKRYMEQILRVTPKGYDDYTLHVDVFFYCPTADNKEEQLQHSKEIARLSQTSFYKSISLVDAYKIKKTRAIYYLLKKLKHIFLSTKRLHLSFAKECMRYGDAETNSLTIITSHSDESIFEKSLLTDIVDYETQIGTFKTARNYEKILEQMYGDYQHPLSLNERIGEIEHSLDMINATKQKGGTNVKK